MIKLINSTFFKKNKKKHKIDDILLKKKFKSYLRIIFLINFYIWFSLLNYNDVHQLYVH